MTTTKAWSLPGWRKPKYKSEGDSLVLDIQKYLEGTEEDSVERELALREAFILATYYPSGITSYQRDGIMTILSLYGREAIRPILLAVGDCSIAEVLDLATAFVVDYNLPKNYSNEELAQQVREQFTQLIKEAKEEHVDVGRSILIWRNHQLVWLQGFYESVVDSVEQEKSSEDSPTLKFMLSTPVVSALAVLWIIYVVLLTIGTK